MQNKYIKFIKFLIRYLILYIFHKMKCNLYLFLFKFLGISPSSNIIFFFFFCTIIWHNNLVDRPLHKLLVVFPPETSNHNPFSSWLCHIQTWLWAHHTFPINCSSGFNNDHPDCQHYLLPHMSLFPLGVGCLWMFPSRLCSHYIPCVIYHVLFSICEMLCPMHVKVSLSPHRPPCFPWSPFYAWAGASQTKTPSGL